MPKMTKRLYRQLRKLPDQGLDAATSNGRMNVRHMPGRETTFFHSGDFGDIIYSLPAIRALGGGHLLIGPTTRYATRLKMTAEMIEIIAPLIRLQPYIRSVTFSEPTEVSYDLNRFRDYLLAESELIARGQPRRNLAEAHLLTFRLPLEECYRPWLLVDQPQHIEGRPVLIHRSARWRSLDFPWERIMQIHGKQAAFVGLEQEYFDFVAEYGFLPYMPTANFLELARLIAGCKLYVGNQSLPYSLAAGLHKESLLEVWPDGPNCFFPRKNAFYGEGKIIYIPKVYMSTESEVITACPLCGASAAQSTVFRDTTDIVKCDKCNLVYLRTRPHQALVHAYYQTYADAPDSHMKLPSTITDIKTSGLRRENFMDEVLTLRPDKGKLLDIGAGWGAFAANARDKGFGAAACEIAHKQANFCATILGIQTYSDDICECLLEKESVDVVTCIHTLEHLRNTQQTLAKIEAILKPGGLFCGIVPNIESLCSQRMKIHWPWLDRNEHFVHFTPATLKACLEKQGLLLVKMITKTGDFSVDIVNRTVAETLDKALTADELTNYIKDLWINGKGEEIWFFASKPTPLST